MSPHVTWASIFATLVVVVVVVVVCKACPTADSRYERYQVLRLQPLRDAATVRQLEAFVNSTDECKEVFVMQDHVTMMEPIAIAVASTKLGALQLFLRKHGLTYEVTNGNMQKTIDHHNMLNNVAKRMYWTAQMRKQKSDAPNYYMRPEEINAWLRSLEKQSRIASVFKIGRSYERRDILGLSINEGRTDLPGVFIEAGMHAREWIAPATAAYVIHRILFGEDDHAIFLRDNFRWYIVPTTNPDGYAYTWDTDRYWRKNRAPQNQGCIGTDLNRNFDFNWGDYGTSSHPCTDMYGGRSAFSEPETRALREALLVRSPHLLLYVSLHAFSQLVLVPYGGTYRKPDDYDALKRVADAASKAMYGETRLEFEVGTPPDILYAASGGSFDWVKSVLEVPYAYTLELRPDSIWDGGFDIDAANILPSGREVTAAISAICRQIRE